MSKRKLPIYLTQHRKEWCLSQEELGILLGTTKSAICKFEAQACPPSFILILATQAIFGATPRDTYPRLFERMHAEVLRRAAKLDERWRTQSGKTVERKRKLLTAILHRAP